MAASSDIGGGGAVDGRAADCCFYEKNTVVLASFLADVSVFFVDAMEFFSRIAR